MNLLTSACSSEPELLGRRVCFRVKGSGFRVLGFGASGFGFRIWGIGAWGFRSEACRVSV